MSSDSHNDGEKGGQRGNVYRMDDYSERFARRTGLKSTGANKTTSDKNTSDSVRGNMRMIHNADRKPHTIARTHRVVARECSVIIQDEQFIDALLYVRSALRKVAAECGITALWIFPNNHNTIIERRQTRFLLDYMDKIEDMALSPLIDLDEDSETYDGVQECRQCTHHDITRLYASGKTNEDHAWADRSDCSDILRKKKPLVTRLAFARRIVHALTSTIPLVTDVTVRMRATDTFEELNAAENLIKTIDTNTGIDTLELICLHRGRKTERSEYEPPHHFVFGPELQGIEARVAHMSHDNPIQTRFGDRARVVMPQSARTDKIARIDKPREGKLLSQYLREQYRK